MLIAQLLPCISDASPKLCCERICWLPGSCLQSEQGAIRLQSSWQKLSKSLTWRGLQNHYVWESGEPAFVKWVLRQPATLLGSAALQREEGLQQHFVAGAVEAYLAECGVAMSRYGAGLLPATGPRMRTAASIVYALLGYFTPYSNPGIVRILILGLNYFASVTSYTLNRDVGAGPGL